MTSSVKQPETSRENRPCNIIISRTGRLKTLELKSPEITGKAVIALPWFSYAHHCLSMEVPCFFTANLRCLKALPPPSLSISVQKGASRGWTQEMDPMENVAPWGSWPETHSTGRAEEWELDLIAALPWLQGWDGTCRACRYLLTVSSHSLPFGAGQLIFLSIPRLPSLSHAAAPRMSASARPRRGM